MTNLPLTGQFRVTCEFRRPGKWSAGWHTGIDLVGNDTIYSTCDGVVHKRGYDKSYGNYIVIRNDVDGKYHWFCHLSAIKKYTGSRVNRSTVIGIMGSTGNSTGKHLHYEIRNASNKYADVVSPADYMGIPNKVGTYNTSNYPIYRSHVQDIGWQNYVSTGNISGTFGQGKRIEAIEIESPEVQYRVHMQDIGWGEWCTNGKMAGTTGQSRRIEAIEFKSNKNMLAQGHVQDIGWQSQKTGKNIIIGTTGQSKRLEAFTFKFI